MSLTEIFSTNIDLSILIRFLMATILGAFIGLEREKIQQKENLKEFGGIRTFTLISMLGFLNILLYENTGSLFPFLSFIALIIFVAISYNKSGKFGITSELGAILTYIIGVLAYHNYLFAIISCIITALILSGKRSLHQFVRQINDKEFLATIEFAILAFIVLPILPKNAVDPWGVFVPYEIWLLILFILGISFIGYILNRVVGENKGTIFTAFIGGIASSTATTQTMSEKSKLNPQSYRILACGTIVASTIMFVRVAIFVGAFNLALMKTILLPMGLMFFTGIMEIFINIYLLEKNSKKIKHKRKDIILQSPFKLSSALKFAIFFILILFFIKFANDYLGTKGLYLAALISGLVDVDVFALSMMKLTQSDPSSIMLAAKGIILVIISNMFFKGGIAYLFGSKKFGRIIIGNFSAITLIGLITIFFL